MQQLNTAATGKTLFSFFMAIVLVVALSFAFPVQSYAVTSAEKQAEADQIERNIDGLQTQINDLQVKYEQAQKDHETAKKAAADAQVQIKKSEKRINDIQDRLSDRATEMYQTNRNTRFLDVLLGAESFEEFITLLDTYDRIAKQDANLVQESKDARAEAEAAKQEYEAQKAKAEEEMANADAAKKDLEVTQASMQEQLKQVTEEIALLKAREEFERMEAERARQMQEEAERLSSQTQVPSVSTGSSASSGVFAHPCPGAIPTSEFGWREWSGTFHTGIDLAADQGTPILASAAGTVSYVGWYGTGGQAVIVNHGNGFRTVYMHMSAYNATVGQQVSQGQCIGYVGSTGNSTGPHLHFNIEINNSPINPRTYVNF